MNKYFKLLFPYVILFIAYGLILPYFVSANNDFLVLTGFLLAAISGIWAIEHTVKIVKGLNNNNN